MPQSFAGAKHPHGLSYYLRVLRVITGAEFKLKYADSALGYVWSLLKPLALFTVLYFVFGRFFKLSLGFTNYPLYLLVGLVLWIYFVDATTTTLDSIVSRGSIMRKVAFPRLIVPMSVTLSATITFGVNLVAIVVFIAWNRVAPQLDWLLLLPLLAELLVFTFGVSILLATLYVRFRDVNQVWELAAQVLFYASPIIYPVQLLPPWAHPIAFLSPFVQVMQDVRALILSGDDVLLVTDALGSLGHLVPVGIAVLTLVGGILLFRREAPLFAERV